MSCAAARQLGRGVVAKLLVLRTSQWGLGHTIAPEAAPLMTALVATEAPNPRTSDDGLSEAPSSKDGVRPQQAHGGPAPAGICQSTTVRPSALLAEVVTGWPRPEPSRFSTNSTTSLGTSVDSHGEGRPISARSALSSRISLSGFRLLDHVLSERLTRLDGFHNLLIDFPLVVILRPPSIGFRVISK